MSEETKRRTFAKWLEKHRRGDLDEELAERLTEVVQAVTLHNKAGSLTLTIGVTPKGRTVVVDDQIKVKVPEADREGAIYFATRDGILTRSDPYQGHFGLTDSADEPGE